jgi:hypothetical protein
VVRAHAQAVVAEFEEEDPLESFMKHMKEKEKEERDANNGDDGGSDGDLEYVHTAPPLVCAPHEHSVQHWAPD